MEITIQRRIAKIIKHEDFWGFVRAYLGIVAMWIIYWQNGWVVR